MTLTVTYDAQIHDRQGVGGVSRYFAELVRAGRRPGSPIDVRLLARATTTPYLSGVPGTPVKLPGWAQRAVPLLNRRRSTPGEFLHHTHYDPAHLPSERDCVKRVVTVYDMIPEMYPEQFAYGNPHLAKRQYVETCDLVICISETTRRDLLAHYGAASGRLVVIPLGVDFVTWSLRSTAPGPPCGAPFVLFVGSRRAYKSFGVVVDAFKLLRADRQLVDLQLVAVGGGELTSVERENIRRAGLEGVVVQREADDNQLARLYAACEAFVFPSEYEGFGLPTLEAMACGAPVVLADAPAHQEVGGSAASYFRTGSAADLATQLLQVRGDQELKLEMRRAGKNRAAEFSWEATTQATFAAYSELGER